jgi:hypothetical protein
MTLAFGGCGDTPPPPKIEVLEPYTIRARVLSKENYWEHWAPVDFFLGWGELLEEDATKGVIVQQGQRLGWWFPPKGSPLNNLSHRVANTHIIVDNEDTRNEILEIKTGDEVYLQGALVEATFANGTSMRSSLSRTDSGMGACEVFLIKKVEVIPQKR